MRSRWNPPHIAVSVMLAISGGTLLSLPATSAVAASSDAVVTGVDEDDMLKLRAGPGTGYRVIVGLPNGSELRNHGCDRVGGTPWCEVSLKEVRKLRGFVSGHYITQE